ncbi:unnamed protein product [Adineta steineri]|uniref:Uncharacterized protein n=1 Tax=Adineta steineri TaxID=433720 RepID=A0A813Q651_9BILA|nr:unnamed protein product [Adineta steineri]CAF1238819.1 unnamed protein product [Adineta steineri]CAF3536490.1 unnamed protein product [Adineta steineri]CAF3936653.1 unnamed protein product [Adineta steineri]
MYVAEDEKIILECDNNDSNRPTFDNLTKLDDESFFVVDQLEDDETDDNNVRQHEILNDINNYNTNVSNNNDCV